MQPTVLENWAFGISALALVFSIASGGYAHFIESHIRTQSDNRSQFDSTITSPLEAKLVALEPILLQISSVAMNEDADTRSKNLSVLQRGDHSAWFFSVEGFIISQQQNSISAIYDKTNNYWDRMSEHINKLSSDLPEEQITKERKLIAQCGEKYLSAVRIEVQKLRLAIR